MTLPLVGAWLFLAGAAVVTPDHHSQAVEDHGAEIRAQVNEVQAAVIDELTDEYVVAGVEPDHDGDPRSAHRWVAALAAGGDAPMLVRIDGQDTVDGHVRLDGRSLQLPEHPRREPADVNDRDMSDCVPWSLICYPPEGAAK